MKTNKINKIYLDIISEMNSGEEKCIPYLECPYCKSENIVEDDSDYDETHYDCVKECNDCGKQWTCSYDFEWCELPDGTKVEEPIYKCPNCGSDEFSTNDWDDKGAVYCLSEKCDECGAEWIVSYGYNDEKTSENNKIN